MTPLDKLTEAVAVTYASGVAGIVGRHPEHAVEVCRFHREGADEFLAAIQAALPEGCYLGREEVVKVTALCPACDRPALHDHNSVRCDDCQGLWPLLSEFDPILFVITPVEADQ